MWGTARHTKASLVETGLDQKYLNIELTETLLMESSGPAAAALEQLSERNMKLHLDDFGTGYSSLTHLCSLPIDTIKLDQSFVAGIGHSERRERVASAVVGIGRRLDLDIVAEGVETEAQLGFLRAEGCDVIQGFLFGKPAPAQFWRNVRFLSPHPLSAPGCG